MFDCIFCAIAILISVIGAFTDVRYGRVKNKHLLVALIAWIGIAAYKAITTHAFPIPTTVQVINLVLSIAAATILYLKDIWAPGDAKLFLVVVLIYPASAYIVREGNIFPSLDFVVYAFALGYICLLLIMMYRKVFGTKVRIVSCEVSNNKRSIKDFLSSFVLNMGLIVGINSLVNEYLPEFEYANKAFCILAIVGLTYMISDKNKRLRYASGGIGWTVFIIILFIQHGAFVSVVFSLIESILIALVIDYLNRQLRKNSYRVIPGSEVRPGMILSFTTVYAMTKCIDPNIPKTTTENRRTRISKAQAIAVQNWSAITKRDITIVEMLPFAPFIALAVIYESLRFVLVMIK